MDVAASTAIRRLCAIATVLVTACAVLSLVWSWPLIGRTFAGFLTTSELRINGVLLPSWSGAQAGLPVFHHVRTVDGQPVTDGRALVRYVASLPPGTTVTYGIETGAGSIVPMPIRTMRFGIYDWVAVCLVHWLVGVGIAVIGILVLWLQPHNKLARFLVVACALMSLLYLGVADATCTYHLVSESATMLNMSWAGGCFGLLSTVFPRRWPHARRWQLAWVVAIVGLSGWFLWEQAFGGDRAILATCMIFPSLGVLTVPLSAAWAAWSRSSTLRQRHQGQVLLIGTLITFALPIGMYLTEYVLSRPLPGMDFCQLAILAFPATLGYAIVRHRLFDIDLALRRTLTYALVAGVLLLAYATITGIAHVLVGPQAPASGLLVTAIIAVAFAPVRDGVKGWLDKRFFRQPYDLVAVADGFQHDACERLEADHLLMTYTKTLETALAPRYITVTLVNGDQCCHGEITPDAPEVTLPLTFDGSTLGLVTIGAKRSDLPFSELDTKLIHDLTQRLAIMVYLVGRLASELEQHQTINALRHADEMRTEFLNVVSHELRRPLGEILASVNILARYDGTLPPQDRLSHHLLQLKASSGVLSRLVNDLLDAGMLQSGHFQLRPAPLTVTRVIDDAVRASGPLAEQKGVTLTAEPHACPVALGDHLRLVQVVSNLLSNAIRHTPSGGQVVVRAMPHGAEWCCEVVDTGDGMDADRMPELFQRFSRLHPEDGSGVGLGLYICKAIVEAHRGRIEAESHRGTGSTFRFYIPMQGPSPETVTPPAHTSG
jgi:signal transduction histidine kinase